jgi:signal transduction histidine kinase
VGPELESARTREAALVEAGLALASERSLDAVLQRIVDCAVEITGTRYGALGVLGPDGGIVELVTTGVSEVERAAIGPLPVGRGILGVLISDARPLRLAAIQDDPRSVGFPPNHPPMRSFLGAPVMARGKVFGNIYLTEKQDAPEFTEEDKEALVVLATQAGVAIENARLYEEAHQRERRLEAVREVTTAILSGADIDEVLPLVAARARELVGADVATIALPRDSEMLAIRAADGDAAGELVGRAFPIADSISGQVIEEGEPALIEDASADQRAHQPIVQLADMGPAMFVPLSIRGQAFGTIAVSNGLGGRTFNDDDLALVQTFADQAAVAIEYARAQREIQRLAVLGDRERIAKELHDGVIQALFAVGMDLQGTAGLRPDPELEHRIEGSVSEIDRVIRDLRNYIFGLRPGILADRQLDQALRDLAESFQEKRGVITVVDVDSTVAAELAPLAADVIQLAREALSNVGRHADARTCRINLHRSSEGEAVLEIDDDGKGFDIEAARGGKGHGLRNLRGRAESVGGRLEIESTAGEGTLVRASFPI